MIWEILNLPNIWNKMMKCSEYIIFQESRVRTADLSSNTDLCLHSLLQHFVSLWLNVFPSLFDESTVLFYYLQAT
jgi:hypothetical protein